MEPHGAAACACLGVGACAVSVDVDRVTYLGRELLEALGEDPDRPGLRDTPARWARAWAEFIDHHNNITATTFETSKVDEMVVVSGIEAWTMCEHHLLPVRILASVGYIPEESVLGLSKFARIVQRRTHALTIQEDLTQAIADDIGALTGAKSIAVYVRGEHLCMWTRGAKSSGEMHTSVMLGAFRSKAEARAEFFSLARKN